MNFVIGDIHGEISKLKQLVSKIQSIDKNGKLIFIGDYLDKGENPKETLNYLIEIKKHIDCVFLLGNHEYYWMKTGYEVDDYLMKYGGEKTIQSFNSDSIKNTRAIFNKNYNGFFKDLVPYFIFENYFICHSGVKPSHYNKKSISNISKKDFLFNRYEFIKSNHLFQKKYKVIFGHTAFYSPYVDKFKIGIDTGACFLKEQPLTSFCIEEEFFLNSHKKIEILSKFPMSNCPNIIRSEPWRRFIT